MTNQEFRQLIGNVSASDAHNLFLTFMIYGGICSIAIMIFIIAKMAGGIRKIQYDPPGIVLTIFLFLFMIMMIFENTVNEIYWIIFAWCLDISGKRTDISKADCIKRDPPVCGKNILTAMKTTD